MFKRGVKTVGIVGIILCLSYSPFIFAGNTERNTPAKSIENGYFQMSMPSTSEKVDPLLQRKHGDFTKEGADSNVTLVSRALYGPADCVASQGSFAYVGAGGALLIFDCSDPDTSLLVGHIYLGKHTYGSLIKYIYVKDNCAYIANDYEGLWIIDVSDRSSPWKVSELSIPWSSRGIHVDGNYAYVTTGVYDGTGRGALWVIDVSDPANPQVAGSDSTIGMSFGIWVEDTCAYICSYPSKLTIMDISEPTSPQLITDFVLPVGGLNVQVSGNIAYLVANGSTGLLIIDVSDPTNPELLSTYTPPGWNPGNLMLDVAVSGIYVYLSTVGRGFWIVDISDPQNPVGVGHISLFTRSITVSNSFAYSAGDFDGLSTIDISDPTSPVETNQYGTGSYCSDVAVAGNYAYVSNSDYGVRIVNISDISNPMEVASYVWPYTNVYSSFIADTLLYVSCMFAPLRVLNIADPPNPAEVAIYSDYRPYNVQVLDTLLYATTCDTSFYILNVADPANPSLVGSCYTSGDMVWTYGLKVVNIENNRYAFVAAFAAGVVVIDVSDPTNPTEVASIPCNNGYDVDVSGNYLYISEYGIFPVVSGGMKVVDISNPTTPNVIGSYVIPFTPCAAFDIAVSGNYVYLAACYMGLRVIDVSNPSLPAEVGYYYTGNGEGARGIAVSESGGLFPYVFVAHTHEGLWVYQYAGVGIEDDNSFDRPFMAVHNNFLQNYPNPFKTATGINYQLPKPGNVTIAIYNVSGQRIKMLVNEHREAGYYTVHWDGRSHDGKQVSNGVYFCRMIAGEYTSVKKMLLTR